MWGRILLRGLVTAGAGSVGVVALCSVYDREKNVVHAAKRETNNYSFHQPTVVWDSNWDRREPDSLMNPKKRKLDDQEQKEELESVTCKSARHLFLIRHGQYCMDVSDDEDKCLTKLGREQANYVGLRLKELDFQYSFIIHSTMTRAAETAEIISEHLPAVPKVSTDMLREGAPIPPEPPVSHWHPEAQQFYEDGARIEAAFRKYIHRAEPCQKSDSYEVMVCHANVIRYFLCRAMQFPPEAWLRFTLHNCSITWLTIHASGRVVLRAVGDAGHIPADKLSTT